MAEKNYRVYCAMHNIPVDDTQVDDDDDEDMDADDHDPARPDDAEDGGMDLDDDDTPEFFKQQAAEAAAAAAAAAPAKTKSRRKKTRVGQLVKDKIRRVLEETDLADKRAGKLDENDFLRLLYAFNKEGIHFS